MLNGASKGETCQMIWNLQVCANSSSLVLPFEAQFLFQQRTMFSRSLWKRGNHAAIHLTDALVPFEKQVCISATSLSKNKGRKESLRTKNHEDLGEWKIVYEEMKTGCWWEPWSEISHWWEEKMIGVGRKKGSKGYSAGIGREKQFSSIKRLLCQLSRHSFLK